MVTTGTRDRAEQTRLHAEVAHAARIVAPLWPLERWIAVNPLLGLVDRGFDGAVASARRWLGAEGHPDVSVLRRALAEGAVDEGDIRAAAGTPDQADELLGLVAAVGTAGSRARPGGLPRSGPRPGTAAGRFDAANGTELAPAVDENVARWLAHLLDPSHRGGADGAATAGPVFERWLDMAGHDRWLHRAAGRDQVSRLEHWPRRADDAVIAALDALGVEAGERVDELRGQLARLPGWAGFARWCDEWAAEEDGGPRLGLLDLLAIRLTCEALVLARHGAPVQVLDLLAAGTPDDDRTGPQIRAALELGYRRRLLDALDRPSSPRPGPEAQVVFCIDARSEGLRRHLEAIGPYDTLGFAGFFAIPMRYRSTGATEPTPSAPVLVRPEVEVPEQPVPGAEAATSRLIEQLASRSAAHGVTDGLAHGPVAMFPTAEAAGWLLGPRALLRTLRPTAPRAAETPALTVQVDRDGDGQDGFSAEERVLIAETALRTMGLTASFAPTVVFCGHGSTSTANPHAASLDCGACGGNRGGPNARALAVILNQPAVRAALVERGITIPPDTWFCAAEHDTTLDTVRLLDTHLAGPEQVGRLDALARDLDAAGAANAAERLNRLPGLGRGRHGRAEARRRAGDWAQTRPEWGLARNAAFIVAPRALTRGVDLDGRAFLHSYDPQGDGDGTALETILTAPMVVAHWINAQYYFSSVDPQVFGAGDKTVHNPVAGIGVLTGGGGDLRVGLPWQSVGVGQHLHHVPLRLLTLVQAPRMRVDEVIARNPVLEELFGGGWVHLVAGDGPGDWLRWTTHGWTDPDVLADQKVVFP